MACFKLHFITTWKSKILKQYICSHNITLNPKLRIQFRSRQLTKLRIQFKIQTQITSDRNVCERQINDQGTSSPEHQYFDSALTCLYQNITPKSSVKSSSGTAILCLHYKNNLKNRKTSNLHHINVSYVTLQHWIAYLFTWFHYMQLPSLSSKPCPTNVKSLSHNTSRYRDTELYQERRKI